MNSLNQQLEERLCPSEHEVGIYNPISGVGIHARDDGCLELYAGGTNILIDGGSGTVTINGRTVNLVAGAINNQTSMDSFNLPTGSLNPGFLPSWAEALGGGEGDGASGMLAQLLNRSPLTATTPASMQTPLVAGTARPELGQYNVKFDSLVKANPLFRKLKKLHTTYKTIKQMVDEFDED
jgi:hypothetical protein